MREATERGVCPHCQSPKTGEKTGKTTRGGLVVYVCLTCSKEYADDDV